MVQKKPMRPFLAAKEAKFKTKVTKYSYSNYASLS
jgi:hypothetical protein